MRDARIVVLGGAGMLGHKMFQRLSERFPETWCRKLPTAWMTMPCAISVMTAAKSAWPPAKSSARMDAGVLEKFQCRAMRFRHPGRHAFRIGREFELDRGGAGEARLADRRQIVGERRVAAPGRHVAMIDAVAVRHMHMGDAALEPPGNLLRRDAHQPEMRDVDRRFHIGKPDLVEEALHRIE